MATYAGRVFFRHGGIPHQAIGTRLARAPLDESRRTVSLRLERFLCPVRFNKVAILILDEILDFVPDRFEVVA